MMIASSLFSQSIATLRIEAAPVTLIRYGEPIDVQDETALVTYDRVQSTGKNHILIKNGPSITLLGITDILIVEQETNHVELYLFSGDLEVDTYADARTPQGANTTLNSPSEPLVEIITINGRVTSMLGKVTIHASHPYHSHVAPTEITDAVHYANAVLINRNNPRDRQILSSSICLEIIFLDTVKRIDTLTPPIPDLDHFDYIEEQIILYDQLLQGLYENIQKQYDLSILSATYAINNGLGIPSDLSETFGQVDISELHEYTMLQGFFLSALETLTEQTHNTEGTQNRVPYAITTIAPRTFLSLVQRSTKILQIVSLATNP